MPTVVAGTPFVFQVLFTDEQNNAIAVNDAVITVYSFATDGTKVVRVISAPMVSVAGETGRYSYAFTATTSLTAGDTFYGMSTATNPASGAKLLVELAVDVVSTGGSSSSCVGMTARFVRGG